LHGSSTIGVPLVVPPPESVRQAPRDCRVLPAATTVQLCATVLLHV